MSDSIDTVHEFVPSKALKPAQPLSVSATVLKLKPSKAKQLRLATSCKLPSTAREDIIEREKASRILKETVNYCCGKGSSEPGFLADHTYQSLYAGYGSIVGGVYLDKAERSLRRLIKLMGRPGDVMTVELWSLASVAGLILKDAEEPGGAIIDDEMKYLKSFVRVVERVCDDRYTHEHSVEGS